VQEILTKFYYFKKIVRKIRLDQKKEDIVIPIPTAKVVGKKIQHVSLTVGIALRFCPTAESTVAIGYSDGKFPWVQRDKVDGRKRPSV
jgi:hypothetical protein